MALITQDLVYNYTFSCTQTLILSNFTSIGNITKNGGTPTFASVTLLYSVSFGIILFVLFILKYYYLDYYFNSNHLWIILIFVLSNWKLGNRGLWGVGKLTDGPCVGANFIGLTVNKETEKDCKVKCGLKASHSILDLVIISGGGCGEWNYCNGSEIDTYSPGLPYE